MKQLRRFDYQSPQEGSVIVAIIYVMLFLTSLSLSVLVLGNANLQRAYVRIYILQAQYAAESGADVAIATLNNTNSSYTGTTSDVTVLSNSAYKATYATTVAAGSSGSQKIITATGKVYRPAMATTATYTRTIRVTAAQSSSTSATGLMSRNIIDVDSSVKNIQASDIYLNGYMNIRSHATNVIANNITVAGKDTGASNCSIEGSGNLVEPSPLPAGQTKENIDLAFNNCINPPGNTSTSQFNITANDSSVTTIQSMYIPWSQYMDNSYQNSPTGCADWTASGSTITIPSTGNTKKTQYPDSGSGVSSSCGSSGDLTLKNGTSATYNITDNVHLRANLCKSSTCSPTFNNTSGSLKYVFIEGTINFTTVHTAAGSSPLVFVTYGADPGTHSKCPYGDSIYMTNNGSDSITAPAAYFLAMNSVCIYQAKFGAKPALGGLGGKNIFIASNSGSPFDLYLNPTFPVNLIPVNLAWRATGYERL